MKLGDRVRCTGYIKKSGNHYEIVKAEESSKGVPSCVFWDAKAEKGTDVEDFFEGDRFVTIQEDFAGVYVGTTVLTTKVCAEFVDHPYQGEYYTTYCQGRKKFAVVYYANNRKRLVPLDMVEVIECGS